MAHQPPPDALTVRLLVYSGRSDPVWTLEGDEAGEVARRLRDVIAGQTVHAAPEPGLGYRGFRLVGGAAFSLPAEFHVFGRFISDTTGGRGRHWIDSADLEDYLLDGARRRGHKGVLDALGVPPSKRTP